MDTLVILMTWQTIFDIVVLADTELVTVFNTGRSWYKIACNSFDYLDNLLYSGFKGNYSIPLDTFLMLFIIQKNI